MDNIIILGHENPDVDSIVSGYLLEKILIKKGYNAKFIIPDNIIEEDTVKLCKENNLNPTKFQKKIDLNNEDLNIILVDHNERKTNGKIICIIDHHPTTKIIKLKHYYNTKSSSTACYICRKNEKLLDKKDINLAVLATMVDTASFNSNKATIRDKKWIINICNKYKLNYDELYRYGLCLTNIEDIDKASINGLKKYNINNKKIESSYIQIIKSLSSEQKINNILDVLKKRIITNKLDAFVFIVHDMKEFKTMYYLITHDEMIIKNYNNYTSRGTTIIPEIEKIVNKKIEEVK